VNVAVTELAPDTVTVQTLPATEVQPLQPVNVEPELADHVDEHARLTLPGAGEAHAVAELLVRPEQSLLGLHRLDVRELKCRHGRQAAPP
jgi:hypothetical protein